MITTTLNLPPQLVAQRAAQIPDDCYLQDVAGPSMTYAEAHQAALHWTAALDALGVTAGGTVATMLPPGIDYTALVLGIAWSPGVEVPINNAAKGALLQYILADSAAQVLFIHERLLAALDLVDLAATGGVRAVIVFGEALPDRPESAVSWRTASDVLAATPPPLLTHPDCRDLEIEPLPGSCTPPAPPDSPKA